LQVIQLQCQAETTVVPDNTHLKDAAAMEIITAIFATLVAAGCFFAILSKDLREGKSVEEEKPAN
jgi:hypothetical protein